MEQRDGSPEEEQAVKDYIVVAGDISSGYRFIGPFKDVEDAGLWVESCSEILGLPDEVLTLQLLEPNQLLEMIRKNKDIYN